MTGGYASGETAIFTQNRHISVVMPVFNEERFLSEAIDSVLGQTYPHWELIIVNDSSIDGTIAIATEYAKRDNRITLLENVGKGKVQAFNTGFSKSVGRYVHLFAGDDIMVPDCLERCCAIVKADRHSVIYHDMLVVEEDLSPISYWRIGEEFSKLDLDEVLVKGVSVPSGCWFFDRSVSELAWPIPQRVPFEDAWLLVCFKTQAQHIAYLPEPLYQYRQNSDQTHGRLDDTSWQMYRYRLERNGVFLDYLLNSQIVGNLGEQTLDVLQNRLCFYRLLTQDKPSVSKLAHTSLPARRKAIVLLAWYMPGLLTWMRKARRISFASSSDTE